MPRLTAFERQLYVATAAAATGQLLNKGRTKPTHAARQAQDFAQAQVAEWRIREHAKQLRRQKP